MVSQLDIPIHMQNVGFKSGHDIILNSICKNFSENERILLLGPNGSGKSTLLKVMAGLLKATGNVLVYGHKPYSNEAKKIRAFVPQVVDFPFKLTVLELINFVQQHYHNKILLDAFCQTYDINLKEYAFNLSEGKKRRLALALALLAKPKLLLLDEPEGGLDVQFRESVLQEILLRNDRNRMSIIMATHFFENSTNHFDRILIIKKGEIIFDEGMKTFLKFKKSISRWDIPADNPKQVIELAHKYHLRHIIMGHTIRLYQKLDCIDTQLLQQNDWVHLDLQQQNVTAEDVYLYHAEG